MQTTDAPAAALAVNPNAVNPNAVNAVLSWEHTHREVLAALIFQHEMGKRGLPSSLRQLSGNHGLLPPRSVYFTPFYYDDFDLGRYHFNAAASSAWLVNLSYEQMHFRCGRSYLLPDGRFAREQMLHCAWGERYRHLLQAHGIPDERIRLTGHPRFDIYDRPTLLFTRAQLAAQFGLDPDKPWILVPYNFNLSYITDRQRRGLEARNYHLSDDFLQGVADAREAFTQMVRDITDRFPDVEVILRVHPAGYESETIYKDEPRLGRNLHLISAFDIANWIRASALVIVWNSTSAMEALVAGVPAISYEPFPFHARFDYDVNRILPTFDAVGDVMAVIDALPNPALTYDWPLFESWYKYRDGNNVGRQIAIIAEAEADFSRFVCRPDAKSRVKSGLQRVRDGLGRRSVAEAQGHDKLAGIAPDVMQRAIETLSIDGLVEVLR